MSGVEAKDRSKAEFESREKHYSELFFIQISY